MSSVAEQTGYPTDLLDLDLDLEADLGIDTVKQAEVFATIREAYGIERDDTLKLRDYPTLNHVVGFVRDRAGTTRQPTRRRSRRRPATSTRARPRNLVAEQTGYPTDLLDPDLDLEADLGIDTVKQAEVFAAIREAYGIERDDTLKLRDYPTLNHVVGFVQRARPRPQPAGAARRPVAGTRRRQRRSRSPPRRPDRRGDAPSASSRSSPSRPATRPTCSTSTSTSRPTSASTPSSRPRCSPRSARPTGSSATTP